MRHLLFIALVAFTPAALAQNWVGVLKNTPAERFDDEDLRLFMDTARKLLRDGKDHETVTWENPDTKAGGEITLLRSFESKGRPCKEVRVRNHAQGRKGDSKVSLCQVDGKWRMLSAQQLKK